jgi:hypothetical protein
MEGWERRRRKPRSRIAIAVKRWKGSLRARLNRNHAEEKKKLKPTLKIRQLKQSGIRREWQDPTRKMRQLTGRWVRREGRNPTQMMEKPRRRRVLEVREKKARFPGEMQKPNQSICRTSQV